MTLNSTHLIVCCRNTWVCSQRELHQLPSLNDEPTLNTYFWQERVVKEVCTMSPCTWGQGRNATDTVRRRPPQHESQNAHPLNIPSVAPHRLSPYPPSSKGRSCCVLMSILRSWTETERPEGQSGPCEKNKEMKVKKTSLDNIRFFKVKEDNNWIIMSIVTQKKVHPIAVHNISSQYPVNNIMMLLVGLRIKQI